jgi:hypothetical protein
MKGEATRIPQRFLALMRRSTSKAESALRPPPNVTAWLRLPLNGRGPRSERERADLPFRIINEVHTLGVLH